MPRLRLRLPIEDYKETHPPIILECDARLIRVGRLNKNKLMFPHFVQDAL